MSPSRSAWSAASSSAAFLCRQRRSRRPPGEPRAAMLNGSTELSRGFSRVSVEGTGMKEVLRLPSRSEPRTGCCARPAGLGAESLDRASGRRVCRKVVLFHLQAVAKGRGGSECLGRGKGRGVMPMAGRLGSSSGVGRGWAHCGLARRVRWALASDQASIQRQTRTRSPMTRSKERTSR